MTALSLAVSVTFSIRSTYGCDFIRLHFEALNDNGIYFNKDESYIGLGFSYHQPLDNRNSIDWINDYTCYEYDEVSTGMFLQNNNFLTMKTYLRSSCNVNIAAIMMILVMGIIGLRFRSKNANVAKVSKTYVKNIPMGENEGGSSPTPKKSALSSVSSILLYVFGRGIVLVMIGTAMRLHIHALSALDEEGGICDRNTYFPNGWYDKYPLQYYRDYAYFKFFHECEIGEDAMHSITAKNWEIAAFVMSSVSLFMNVVHALFSCSDLSLDIDDSTVGSTGIEEHTVMKQFPLEVESDNHDFEGETRGSPSSNKSSSIMVGIMTKNEGEALYINV